MTRGHSEVLYLVALVKGPLIKAFRLQGEMPLWFCLSSFFFFFFSSAVNTLTFDCLDRLT